MPKNIAVALNIPSTSVSVSTLLVLPVYTWCSQESYGVDGCGNELGVPGNITTAAEIITLISFSVAKLQLLPVSVRHLELQREGSVGCMQW